MSGWWVPMRRGLFSDPTGKHFRNMGNAIWLYGHLHQAADWKTGHLLRTYRTLSNETGIPQRTLQRMMNTLKVHKYIEVTQLARSLAIKITKWRPVSTKAGVANNGGGGIGEDRHFCRQGSPLLTSPAISGEPLNGSSKNVKQASPATSGEPIKSPLSKPNIYTQVFNFWNDQKITIHREPEKFKSCINACLKNYTPEELYQAIRNYADILNSPDHFFSYRWTLSDFLNRKNGIDRFIDREVTFNNFRKKGLPESSTEPHQETEEEKQATSNAVKQEFERLEMKEATAS